MALEESTPLSIYREVEKKVAGFSCRLAITVLANEHYDFSMLINGRADRNNIRYLQLCMLIWWGPRRNIVVDTLRTLSSDQPIWTIISLDAFRCYCHLKLLHPVIN